jgi:hypothetical protein
VCYALLPPGDTHRHLQAIHHLFKTTPLKFCPISRRGFDGGNLRPHRKLLEKIFLERQIFGDTIL